MGDRTSLFVASELIRTDLRKEDSGSKSLNLEEVVIMFVSYLLYLLYS